MQYPVAGMPSTSVIPALSTQVKPMSFWLNNTMNLIKSRIISFHWKKKLLKYRALPYKYASVGATFMNILSICHVVCARPSAIYHLCSCLHCSMTVWQKDWEELLYLCVKWFVSRLASHWLLLLTDWQNPLKAGGIQEWMSTLKALICEWNQTRSFCFLFT